MACEDSLFVSVIGPTELNAGESMPGDVHVMVTWLGQGDADIAVELFLVPESGLEESDSVALLADEGTVLATLTEGSSQLLSIGPSQMVDVPLEMGGTLAALEVRAGSVAGAACEGPLVTDFYTALIDE